ncbi:MAG: molybdopterin-guanine dinucleotide biosynthesis protein B [Fibrobacterales bacterium]
MTSTCGIDKSSTTKKKRDLFHPFELLFCGFSGSGKTTLISTLISHFSKERTIGYVKHDAHHFAVDHPGKDTHKATSSGASQVLIQNSDTFALMGSTTSFNHFNQVQSLIQNDWVFIEGYKESATPKIVVIDSKQTIITSIENGSITDIIAIVYPDSPITFANTTLNEIPQYSRDDIDSIKNIVTDFMLSRVSMQQLNGLVLTGGKSSRMQQNKGTLDYHGVPQQEYLHSLLSPICHNTFLSVAHSSETVEKQLPEIVDTFTDMGPLGGILTALREYRTSAFLTIACDLPYLDSETIEYLIKNRNPFKAATTFINQESGFPEPLCTIYEPKFYQIALQFTGLGYACPRKVLINSAIESLTLKNTEPLFNANTPEERDTVFKKLNQR